jgi:aminoglycoside phosphotransferase (APT) family kinase protein
MSESVGPSVRPASPRLSAINDPGIATLAAALDPGELGRHLEGLAVSQPLGASCTVRVKVLRWHSANRCTFEIALQKNLIGKVYAKDREDVYQVMERVSQAGFGPEAEFSVPLPIAYLPSLRLLLQERIEGTPAKEVLLGGDERQRAVAAERCARWLAQFHARAPLSGQVSGIEKILRLSEQRARFISEAAELLAGKAEQLLEGLRAAAPYLDAIPMCAGHGDYSAGQIIFADGRTVTFDFDHYDVADPSRDVESFMVGLERLALHRLGSLGALDGAAEVFLRAYLAASSQAPAAHLTFYKAVNCLKGAQWDLKKKTDFKRRKRAEAMLDLGLRALATL